MVDQSARDLIQELNTTIQDILKKLRKGEAELEVNKIPNLTFGKSAIRLKEANYDSTGLQKDAENYLTHNLKKYLTLLRQSTQSLQFETQTKADESTNYQSNAYDKSQNYFYPLVTQPKFKGTFKRNRINDPALGLEIYKTYRGLIEHENSLLNQRVNWFLASQTFLIAAVAAVATSYTFFAGIIIILISILGMKVSEFSQHNIILSLLAIDVFNNEWKQWYYGNLQNYVQSIPDPTRENSIIQPPNDGKSFNYTQPVGGVNLPPNLGTKLKCFLDDSPGFTVQVKNMLPRQLLFNTKDTDQNFYTLSEVTRRTPSTTPSTTPSGTPSGTSRVKRIYIGKPNDNKEGFLEGRNIIKSYGFNDSGNKNVKSLSENYRHRLGTFPGYIFWFWGLLLLVQSIIIFSQIFWGKHNSLISYLHQQVTSITSSSEQYLTVEPINNKILNNSIINSHTFELRRCKKYSDSSSSQDLDAQSLVAFPSGATEYHFPESIDANKAKAQLSNRLNNTPEVKDSGWTLEVKPLSLYGCEIVSKSE